MIGVPTVVGSVGATQLGAPWTVIASVIGQPTVTASVIGVLTVGGSVGVTQVTSPWVTDIGRIRRPELVTFADTIAQGGSYTTVMSGLEFYTAVRVVFRTDHSSLSVLFDHAVASGTWLYTQDVTVSSAFLVEYEVTGPYARLRLSNPASATFVQGGVYASPIT